MGPSADSGAPGDRGPAAERAAAAAEHRYREIFEQAPLPCLLVGSDGTVRDCNRAARTVIGPGIERGLIDRHIRAADRSTFRQLRADCADRWIDATVEVSGLAGLRRMHIDCAKVEDDLLMILMHDVTALADAHERVAEVAERNRELVERLRNLDEIRQLLLLTVSHDLRTPLAVIAGLAGILENHGELTEDERHHLAERIHSNADWVVEQFAHVLDVQRLDAGADVLRREPVDLPTLINGCLDRLEVHDRVIITDLEPVTAEVDRTLCERLVDNLLRNMHRHTPADTKIWIRVRRVHDDVSLVIEDDGPGVPEGLVPRLFQLFQRDRRPDSAEGLGVGLYLVRRFAELHGGAVWYEHRDGGGASFHISIPITP